MYKPARGHPEGLTLRSYVITIPNSPFSGVELLVFPVVVLLLFSPDREGR